MRITLDPTLERGPIPSERAFPQYLTQRLGAGLTFLAEDLDPAPGPAPCVLRHLNFLDCLSAAWAAHLGVRVTPDVLWHALLCEVSRIVLDDPEEYRHLFTRDPAGSATREISVQADDPVRLPLEKIVAALRAQVPSDVDAFLPEFSTSTPHARAARHAAFAEALSPYYHYSMFLCGIPFVEVDGTPEDWALLRERWDDVAALLGTHTEYCHRVSELLEWLHEHLGDPAVWAEMFSLRRCGSGHQQEVAGWWAELYRERPPVGYPGNFATHVAQVDYRNLSTGADYRSYHGVLASHLEGDLLSPLFGRLVFKKG